MNHAKNYPALAFGLILVAVLAGAGCATRVLPPPPGGVALQPGAYLLDYYYAPGFDPTQTACTLGPFTLEEAQGLDQAAFLAILQEELVRAWQGNGLKVAASPPPPGSCALTGAVDLVRIRGERLRAIMGRLKAQLVVSGTISRDGQVLFAFRDRLSLDSPVNPGAAAPKEKELLLRQVAQEFAHHLLDEMLLHGLTAGAG